VNRTHLGHHQALGNPAIIAIIMLGTTMDEVGTTKAMIIIVAKPLDAIHEANPNDPLGINPAHFAFNQTPHDADPANYGVNLNDPHGFNSAHLDDVLGANPFNQANLDDVLGANPFNQANLDGKQDVMTAGNPWTTSFATTHGPAKGNQVNTADRHFGARTRKPYATRTSGLAAAA
jgi:hypothetical protein